MTSNVIPVQRSRGPERKNRVVDSSPLASPLETRAPFYVVTVVSFVLIDE